MPLVYACCILGRPNKSVSSLLTGTCFLNALAYIFLPKSVLAVLRALNSSKNDAVVPNALCKSEVKRAERPLSRCSKNFLAVCFAGDGIRLTASK